MNHGATPNSGQVIHLLSQAADLLRNPPTPVTTWCPSLLVKWPERAADPTHLYLVSRLRASEAILPASLMSLWRGT
jgi:hypothetical protein